MNIKHLIRVAFALMAGIVLVPIISSAQSEVTQNDSVVAVVADAQGLPLVPAEELPTLGTFWVVQSSLPCLMAPFPFPPFDSSLPVYAVCDGQFLVDETRGQLISPARRALLNGMDDSAILNQQVNELVNFIGQVKQSQLSSGANTTTMLTSVPPPPGGGGGSTNGGGDGGVVMARVYTTNDLWLELVGKTNTTSQFVLHIPANEATNAVYDIFETTNLNINVPGLNGTNWLWVLRTQPGQTNFMISDLTADQTFFRAAQTNDTDGDGMSDAYEHLSSHTDPYTPDAPIIVFQPLSQTVDKGDTVRFNVIAQGPSPLRYQWLFDGTNIVGETNSSLTIAAVQNTDAGDYSVQVIGPSSLFIVSSNATLTVQNPDNWPVVTLTGSRQNYTFKNGVTYYVGSRVELYGNTTIEGGAVIKPDWYSPDSTLAIMGTLECKTDDPYFPAFFTSVDDDMVGDALQFSSGIPTAISNGAPYLDLTYAQGVVPSLNNLRIRYAAQGVVTPVANRLDVWNCQFYQCNSAFIAGQDSTIGLHNILFGGCGAVVAGSTNFVTIEAEQVTAEATNFWSHVPPAQIRLTNSIIVGNIGTGPTLVTDHAAINPANPVFQPTGSGSYYLTNASPYRQAGTTNISPRLFAEFRQKTTQPPIDFPPMMQIAGNLTLCQQAARYTNGSPDYGYHYPALDYTLAWMTNRGAITVLPGTAIGFRNEYAPAHNRYTWWGFDLREDSSFVSHGTPTRPNVFADVQFVQEQQSAPCVALFMPDFFPLNDNDVAPSMDFQFSRFYANASRYHVWAGYEETANFLQSPDSAVNWSMRDCELHGGRVNLGPPDDGFYYGAPMDWFYGKSSVSWVNNLFDSVAITLNPSYYWFDGSTNCDMTFAGMNNLFRGGEWLFLSPVPATGGNWTLTDNLFDKVTFAQDTNAPLDFHHNGYWPLTSAETLWADSKWATFHTNDYYSYPYVLYVTNQLQAATNSGVNEQFLTSVPPYQAGPLGNFYLPSNTLMYHAGSRSGDDAGLHQYTTRVDQTKEGAEIPSGHNVSIGLHYIATPNATSTTPQDSDGDGVPDFIEDANGNGIVDSNETSPLLAQTVSGINDATNSVYDDIDLSGNGLVGRIKRALNLNPLDANNPLVLQQIATGEEPDFATFEVPISYDLVTNVGTLNLSMNGIGVTLEECTRATNGNCLLSFNVAFDPMGLHYLSPWFHLSTEPPAELQSVTAASGNLRPFYSSNPVQFFESGSMFDDAGAYLDAKLFETNADYQIDLYDPSTTPPVLLKTITNSTTSGMIQEDWDLKMTNGITLYTNDEIQAVFSVSYASRPGNVSTNKPKKIIIKAKGSLSESGPNMDFVYFRTPTNNAWASEFAKDGAIWKGMQGVVDVLIKPAWGYEVYLSYFNRYLPDDHQEYPGYITKRLRATNDLPTLPTVIETLLPDMTNGVTKQIYMYGHGNNGYMGNWDNSAYITAYDVGSRLNNTYTKKKGLVAQNPYRLVWLDGCATASGKDWRRAFGIYPIGKGAQQQAAHNKVGPQAYVGWASDHSGGLHYLEHTPTSVDLAKAYTTTLNKFYALWMQGFRIRECIDQASTVTPNMWPIPVPQNKTVTNVVNGTTYYATNQTVSPIYIIGFPGLQVDRTDHSLDGDNKYAAPENVE